MKRIIQKGFTLIELLVVIAIIGILAAIVLASLSTARLKAKDATVEDQLSSMRAAAELYSESQGDSYGTYATLGSCAPGTVGGAGGLWADPTSNMLSLINATAVSINGNPISYANMDCGVSNTAWSVAAKLPSGSGYSCVDSTGTSRNTTAGGTNYSGALTGASPAPHSTVGATVCQ